MIFESQQPTRMERQRSFALLISVGVHAVLIMVLVIADGIGVPVRAPSEYTQKIEGKESKVVWYKFRKELPEMKPARKAADRPLQADTIAKQAIVSSPKNAPKRTQMVWTPAPEIAPVPLMDLPNLIAVKLPEKPPPPAKAFVAPPAIAPRPVARTEVAGAAPLLETFETHVGQLPSTKLPPKPYVAPPAVLRPAVRVNPLSDAPQLADAGLAMNALNVPAPKLPPRPFTAPVSGPGAEALKSVAVDAPPPLDMQANSHDLNVAIVGLNPLDTRAPIPVASSPGQFSAGQQKRSSGALADGPGKGLSVPDLFVRGPGDNKLKSDLIAQAYAAPTSQQNLRAVVQRGEPVMTVHMDPSVSSTPGATKVSGAPDPRFNGRDVYLMAIQMPNLTSYSGSWLMWYSARTLRATGLAPIAAPVPHRKVDPKYIATAVEERIEGRVQLACVIDRQGKVSDVELVRGVDDRLNQSAREALSKWEFYPALRNGEPVDVDVLVEIPFKLAPRVATR